MAGRRFNWNPGGYPGRRGGYPGMKKTARKHPWTSRPEVRSLIDTHENTELEDDRYSSGDHYNHQNTSSDQYQHYRDRDDYTRRDRENHYDIGRGRGDQRNWEEREYGYERQRSRSRDYSERSGSRNRDYYEKRRPKYNDYDRSRRSNSRNRNSRHEQKRRDESHYRHKDRSRSKSSGNDSNRSNGASHVSSLNRHRLNIEETDSSSQGSPVRSWRFERKESNRNVDLKSVVLSKVATDTKVQNSESDIDSKELYQSENETQVNGKSDDEILSMSSEEMRKDGTSPYTNGENVVTISIEIKESNDDKENIEQITDQNKDKNLTVNKDSIEDVKVTKDKLETTPTERDKKHPAVKETRNVKITSDGGNKAESKSPVIRKKDNHSHLKDILKQPEENLNSSPDSAESDTPKNITETPMQQTHNEINDVVGLIVTDQNYTLKHSNHTENNQAIVKGIHKNIINMQFAAPLQNRHGNKSKSGFLDKEQEPVKMLKTNRRSGEYEASKTENMNPETKRDTRNKQEIAQNEQTKSNKIDRAVVNEKTQTNTKIIHENSRLSEIESVETEDMNHKTNKGIGNIQPENEHKTDKLMVNEKMQTDGNILNANDRLNENKSVNKETMNDENKHQTLNKVGEPGHDGVLKSDKGRRPKDGYLNENKTHITAKLQKEKRRSTDTADIRRDNKQKQVLRTANSESTNNCSKQGNFHGPVGLDPVMDHTENKDDCTEMATFDVVGQIIHDSEKNKNRKPIVTSTPSKSMVGAQHFNANTNSTGATMEDQQKVTRDKKRHNSERNDIVSEELPSFKKVCLDKSKTVAERISVVEKNESLFNKNKHRHSLVKKSSDHTKEKIEYIPLGQNRYNDKGKNKHAPTANIFERLGGDFNLREEAKSTTEGKMNKNQTQRNTGVLNLFKIKDRRKSEKVVEETIKDRGNSEKVVEETQKHERASTHEIHKNKTNSKLPVDQVQQEVKHRKSGLEKEDKGKRLISGKMEKTLKNENDTEKVAEEMMGQRNSENEVEEIQKHKRASTLEIQRNDKTNSKKEKHKKSNAEKKDNRKRHSSGKNDKTLKNEFENNTETVVEETRKHKGPSTLEIHENDKTKPKVFVDHKVQEEEKSRKSGVEKEDKRKRHSSGKPDKTLKNEHENNAEKMIGPSTLEILENDKTKPKVFVDHKVQEEKFRKSGLEIEDKRKRHSSGKLDKTLKNEHEHNAEKVVEEKIKDRRNSEVVKETQKHEKASTLEMQENRTNSKLPVEYKIQGKEKQRKSGTEKEDSKKQNSSGKNDKILKNESENNTETKNELQIRNRHKSGKKTKTDETSVSVSIEQSPKLLSMQSTEESQTSTSSLDTVECQTIIEDCLDNNSVKDMNENRLKDGLSSLGVDEDDFEPIDIQPCPTPMILNKETSYEPPVSDISDDEKDSEITIKCKNSIKYIDDRLFIETSELDNNKRKSDTDTHIPVKKRKVDHHTPHKMESLKEGRKLKFSDSPRKTNFGERLTKALKGLDEPLSPETIIANNEKSESSKKKKTDSPAKTFLKKAKKKIKVPKPSKRQTEISEGKYIDNQNETNLQNKTDRDNLAESSIQPKTNVEDKNESQSESQGTLEPSSPVLKNGFDITYKLTLKDSRKITTVGHLNPQKLAEETCIKCDVCTQYFSPLEFAEHHDSAEIVSRIDRDKCSDKNFQPQQPTIILWNEKAQQIWEDFLELFKKERRNLSVEKSKGNEKSGKAAAAGSVENPETSESSETQDDIKVGNIRREKLRARAVSGPGVFSPKIVSWVPESFIKDEGKDLVSTERCDQGQLSKSDRSPEPSEISQTNEMQSTPAGSKHSETGTVIDGDTNAAETVSSNCEHIQESQAPQSNIQTPSCSNTGAVDNITELKPEVPNLFLFDQHTTALDASLFSETELLTELKKKFGCHFHDTDYGDLMLGLKLQNRSVRRMLQRKHNEIVNMKDKDKQMKEMIELNKRQKHIQANMEMERNLERQARK